MSRRDKRDERTDTPDLIAPDHTSALDHAHDPETPGGHRRPLDDGSAAAREYFANHRGWWSA